MQVLRASLRIRANVLPPLTSAAAIAVLVSSSYTSADILLNLLAVSFICEADNVIATIFLRPEAHKRAEAGGKRAPKTARKKGEGKRPQKGPLTLKPTKQRHFLL